LANREKHLHISSSLAACISWPAPGHLDGGILSLDSAGSASFGGRVKWHSNDCCSLRVEMPTWQRAPNDIILLPRVVPCAAPLCKAK
jgi:hypothetical protein